MPRNTWVIAALGLLILGGCAKSELTIENLPQEKMGDVCQKDGECTGSQALDPARTKTLG